MELKCQFTGQDTENAIRQYKFDRAGKDTIFEFKNRVLVHFAVDLCNVYMTTRLMGANTYFLPFNQGSNGAGQVGGKGNPPNPSGYPTAYLWERVLCKDGLLDILHKYMHVQKETLEDRNGRKTVKETMIFPRYHQLDVVTSLIGDARANGAGKNYLIQHSAGSGKSNSIAWLAYRLMSLHDDVNEKIFRSVVVVTDRKVLDSQLQDTIYQFDHVDGVVQKIDENSKQLLEALNAGAGFTATRWFPATARSSSTRRSPSSPGRAFACRSRTWPRPAMKTSSPSAWWPLFSAWASPSSAMPSSHSSGTRTPRSPQPIAPRLTPRMPGLKRPPRHPCA